MGAGARAIARVEDEARNRSKIWSRADVSAGT